MSLRLFGTDGIRGIPGRYPLTSEMVRRVGYAAATVLRRRRGEPARARNGSLPGILMGRDPRASGLGLMRQLAQGMAKAGFAVLDAGIIPTAALAYLVPRRGALCGVMVSASHNPAEFNGIKFFAGEGFKLSLETEREIEDRLQDMPDPRGRPARLIADPAAERDYFDFLKSTFPVNLDLSGVRLAVDCANGSAYRVAPRLLRELGAEVFAIGCSPNGRNINRGCGALDIRALREEIRRRRCGCGAAFDGDADRVIFADEEGAPCDGDVLLSMAATDLQERRALPGGKIALTVMSNYGMIRFLEEGGIGAVQVPVGDRNVSEALDQEGLGLGGESSGHIIFRRFGPTGDGLLTALQILAILVRSGLPLSRFRKRFQNYPQVLRSIRVENQVPLEEMPRLRRCIRDCERRLHGDGRVLVRYSGTEPLIRILVEGPDRRSIRRISNEITETFLREIQAHVH
ncbi:MAG: phosphoglucosamine mutase [Elusimicrobia bacterium]|nr:phosphoglucosamine mutase [Elusimicrobiota bacterium]